MFIMQKEQIMSAPSGIFIDYVDVLSQFYFCSCPIAIE
jgi:hypothetical protein